MPAPLPVPTETGLAEQLAAFARVDHRFCPEWRKWLSWNGNRWVEDVNGSAIQRRIKTLLRDTRIAAARADDKAVSDCAFASERARARKAIQELASHEETLQVAQERLDRRPFLFNVANGTVDLETGALREASREDYLTKGTQVRFDQRATAPRWLAFLREVFCGDTQLIRYVQRAVGYSMTGDVREQSIFLLNGSGANGKSTFMLVLAHLLGDYAQAGVPDLLLAKPQQQHPTELASLRGARLVSFQETPRGRHFDEARLKALTGGDPITARRMNEDFWTFIPTHKFFLSTNSLPSIRDNGEATWRRIRVIPFRAVFASSKRDPKLLSKLLTELPGILRWALDGCLRWRLEGLAPPSVVERTTAQYRAAEDHFSRFLRERCRVRSGLAAASGSLLEAFNEWARQNGEATISAPALARELTSHAFTPTTLGHAKVRGWKGLSLTPTRTGADGFSGTGA